MNGILTALSLAAKFLRRHRAASAAWIILTLPAAAQTTAPPATAPDGKPVDHVNGLGMMFREVKGSPVLFSIWETRLSDWQAFLKASQYKWNETAHFPQSSHHPVVNVNLRDAAAFCAWLTESERTAGRITKLQSYRLPTNREWSAAAGLAAARYEERSSSEKLDDAQAFPWGAEWPPPRSAGNLNFAEINGTDDGFLYTAPVGQFAPSESGLYDLAGNAWEWTWDQKPGSDAASATLRGGSWMYFKKECLLSAYLYQVPAELRAPSTGFRCVFEDRKRTAEFMASVEKTARETSRERRDQLMTRPGVTPEEVARMRAEIAAARSPMATEEATLPDPASLKPAAPGQTFLNTLGMTFRPLPGTAVLICETETRIQDYEAAMAAQGRVWTPKPSFDIKPSHPVMNVGWAEAKKFCDWLTERDRGLRLIPATARYRLPTDAEWSTAVGLKNETGDSPLTKHLSNKTDFPWGQQPVPPVASANLDAANMAGTGYQDNFTHTAPVRSFSPNALHLYDLAGNVSEWCEDAWPGAPAERVVRGSSWLSSTTESLLSSARRHLPADAVHSDVGFRCVLELPAP